MLNGYLKSNDSYSVAGNVSGIDYDATAFVGCDNGHVSGLIKTCFLSYSHKCNVVFMIENYLNSTSFSAVVVMDQWVVRRITVPRNAKP